jgi:two-component system, NarL family, nitrate/nitrite response regulator NarL
MRLVLCDENRLLGEALGAVLTAAGHEAVAITTSVAAGVAAVAEHMPDACLLGVMCPGGSDGLAAMQEIQRRCPQTAVVLLAAEPDRAAIWEAKRLGAAGFLSKDLNVAQIAQALDVVAAGGAVFDPVPGNGVRAVAPRRSQLPCELTPREREVLHRIVVGQSTGQMASEMNIAISTLRTYVKNLLTKLGTHSRLQAAAMASREGLLTELPA